ncbi:MAG: transglycosylase SLT domain-containing protein [Myxococcaceae bacterium]|nr:transglycosylase SLT domain-containing protein [Myxococcaceae bacterium]
MKRSPACADAGRLGLLLGTQLVAEGQAAEAARVLSQATPPPLLVPYHAFAMGQARLALGDAAGAVEPLRRASQDVAPGALATRARTRLGEALLAAGQPGEALPLLDAAVKREPTPELLVQRARARHATGDAKRAGADLRSVVVGSPAHPLAQEAQALSVQLLGAPLTLTYEERLTRARGLLDAGRAEAALVELVALRKDKLARGAAAAARLALQRGRTLYALGRDTEAKAEVARARRGPAAVAAEALMMEARRTLRTDDHARARAQMAEVDRRFPKEPDADDAAYYVGWLHFQDAQYDEAVAAFTRFSRRHPRSRKRDEAQWYSALARIEQGRHAEARESLAKLLADFPASSLVPQARYWKARCAQLEGTPEGALAEYAALVDAYPHTYYALLARARLAEAGRAPPPGFPSPPRARVAAPAPELDVVRALSEAGMFREADEEVEVLLGTVRTGEEALRLGHALATMEQHGAAHALASRFLWAEAFSRKDPEALALFYPRAWAGSVQAESTRASIEPALVWAIMRRESTFRPGAHSHANARGLMQLIPPTAEAIARELGDVPPTPAELFSPGVNVRYAATYLSRLLERFKHPALVAAAYNGGPPVVLRWVSERKDRPLDLFVEEMSFRETRAYVKQVLADLHLYRAFYGGAPAPLALEVPAPSANGVTY